MKAWLALSLEELRAAPVESLLARLNLAQSRRFATNELTQLHSWESEGE